VSLLREIGIPELTEDQMQTLSEIAEKAARDYVLAKTPKQKVTTLNITVEAVGSKPVNITIEVELALSPPTGTLSEEKLANEATEKAFEAVEAHLRELSCTSKP
jgi:hypothetical protein